MNDRVTRVVEGHEIVTSGSLVCPHPEWCDQRHNETYDAYVRRHAEEHNLGTFAKLIDAERNLGLWCFYFDHKYIYGNPELHPYPHWEIHAFISEPVWSERALDHRTPLAKRKNKRYIAPAAERPAGEIRRFKQVEVPRQCQKTSIGARAYTIFRAKREYFVNGRRNYRRIIRSATGKNTRDTLNVIRRVATKNVKIEALYGIWLINCAKCGHSSQTAEKVKACPACKSKTVRHRRISLINTALGSGGLGLDQISFRWLTDSADAVAAYSVWVAGLKTETTGQRPDGYTWDDPQTEDNSDTVEKREYIHSQFDGSVRELQFGGELLVLDTRKYVSDFAGKIGEEPLVSLFFSLRREVRWRTDEPDNAPWVVDGWRYYYPVKGDGTPALDANTVAELRAQMVGRKFSAEYMNDPLNEGAAKFKREHFKIVSRSEDRKDWPVEQTDMVPPEVRYGLGGRHVTAREQAELDHLRVRITAINLCDPSGHAKQRKTGDDTFIVATRTDRHGRIFVTNMAAGRWGSKRIWDEIEKASVYNGAQFTDYEMPASEQHIEAALEKWVRERSEEQTRITGQPTTVRLPVKFTPMPKSTKDSRIDQMENYLPIYILDDAADPDLIEKYISQWIGRGSEDHDDGPDATSRIIRYISTSRYRPPSEEQQSDARIQVVGNETKVSLAAIQKLAAPKREGGLWGQQGTGPRCMNCGKIGCTGARCA